MGSVLAVEQMRGEAGMGDSGPIISWFEEVNKDSVALVGGKCSSLGELINAGVRVPPGFAVTTRGYRQFMEEAGIQEEVGALLRGLDHQDMDRLEAASCEIRSMVESRPISVELEDAIAEAYRKLSVRSCVPAVPVAVRSSATAEDLPGASFAGQQDTYLWIRGVDSVLHHVRRCISSLYTGRAIAYRMKMGFPHEQVAISVGVQKMANSLTAGVMFTLHPTNGDRSVIVIDSNFGFGESVVSGEVTPDHFVVNKVALDILERTVSTKQVCYTVDFKEQKSVAMEVPFERQNIQSIVDDEITELAWMGKQIEKHYGRPMDIEWAIDKDLPAGGNIFILQARPETVWSDKPKAPASSGAMSAMDFIVSSLIAGKKVSVGTVQGLIRLIQTNSKTNVLANPQIIALDNTQASFKSTEKIPILKQTVVPNVGTQVTPDSQPVELSIALKPSINKMSNFVKLEVEANFGDVSGRALPSAVAGQAIATLDRTAKTSVVVGDGDTVALGGLTRDKVAETQTKIPVLGDIPVLGWLFKSKQSTTEKSNLLIFLTPRIVRQYEKVRAILDRKLKERDDFIEENAGGEDLQRKKRDAIIRDLPDIKELTSRKPQTSVSIDEDETAPAAQGAGDPFSGQKPETGAPAPAAPAAPAGDVPPPPPAPGAGG